MVSHQHRVFTKLEQQMGKSVSHRTWLGIDSAQQAFLQLSKKGRAPEGTGFFGCVHHLDRGSSPLKTGSLSMGIARINRLQLRLQPATAAPARQPTAGSAAINQLRLRPAATAP